MSNWDDKVASQALGKELLPDFAALPRTGPGRWVRFPEGTVLYTDDANILFAIDDNDETTVLTSNLVVATSRMYEAGKSATEAFEELRGDLPVVSGDLSELG
ncbi:hypothetical protein [Gordonia terrae]